MENSLASSLLDQSLEVHDLYFALLEMLLETNREIYVPYKGEKMYFETIQREKGLTSTPADEYYRRYIFYFDLIDHYRNDLDITFDYKKMKIRDFIDKVVKEAPSSQISFRGYGGCCYNTDAIFDIWGYCYNPRAYNYHKHSKLVKEPI